MDFEYRNDRNINDVERVWVEVKPENEDSFLLCSMYRQPSFSVNYYNNMLDIIQRAQTVKKDTVSIFQMI